MRKSHSVFPIIRTFSYLLLLCLVAITGVQGQGAPTDMRIGLQTKEADIRLQSTLPVTVTTLDGKDTLTIPACQVVDCTFKDGKLIVLDPTGVALLTTTQAVQVRPAPAKDTTAIPLISLLGPTRHYDGKPDRPYRGYFEIQPYADGLTAVNVVGIEPYLYGVVSSEMGPGYPLEALKAQAVAARTYALKNRGRFASLGFDLDDTPACQVYGGYFNEIRAPPRQLMTPPVR